MLTFCRWDFDDVIDEAGYTFRPATFCLFFDGFSEERRAERQFSVGMRLLAARAAITWSAMRWPEFCWKELEQIHAQRATFG